MNDSVGQTLNRQAIEYEQQLGGQRQVHSAMQVNNSSTRNNGHANTQDNATQQSPFVMREGNATQVEQRSVDQGTIAGMMSSVGRESQLQNPPSTGPMPDLIQVTEQIDAGTVLQQAPATIPHSAAQTVEIRQSIQHDEIMSDNLIHSSSVPRLIQGETSPIHSSKHKAVSMQQKLNLNSEYGGGGTKNIDLLSRQRQLDHFPGSMTSSKNKTLSPREPVESIERINHFLEVDALFWDRDSHGLFDYDSKILKDHKMQTSGCFLLVRDENTLKTVMPKLGCPESYQQLLSVVYKSGAYWAYHTKTLYKPDGDMDEKYNHFEQAWQIIRLQNQLTKKLTTPEEIQNRNHKVKDVKDSVKVELGDVMKFGRVRFRVKKLHVTVSTQPKAEKNSVGPLNIDAINDLRLSEMGNDTQLYSRRSTETGMDQMVRMHSSANYSFDMQKQSLEEMEPIEDEAQKHQSSDQKNVTENMICRICLSEEEADHELISPCKCGGSMRYIGLSCLKSWLEGKRHFKETPIVNSYIWKNLECEICKSPFKDIFIGQDGRELNLLNYNLHDDVQNYMIIESVTQTTSKTIHVINFDARQSVKVGRAQAAEVRITDISVSRHHSNLTLNDDGTISLTDNYSKFGTLKLLRKPIQIPVHQTGIDETLFIQVGRAVLALGSFPRYNWWQKLNCCWQQSRKRKTQVENFLHFEESPDQFPIEYCLMFGGAFSKFQQDFKSGLASNLAHYRTRSGNQDAIPAQIEVTNEDPLTDGQVPQTQMNVVNVSAQDHLVNASLQRDTEMNLINQHTSARGEESKNQFDQTSPSPMQRDRLGSTRPIPTVTGSITDFTLRLNPSAEQLATQANEDTSVVGGARGNQLSVRQSVEINQLLTQEGEIIAEQDENEDVDPMASPNATEMNINGQQHDTEILPISINQESPSRDPTTLIQGALTNGETPSFTHAALRPFSLRRVSAEGGEEESKIVNAMGDMSSIELRNQNGERSIVIRDSNTNIEALEESKSLINVDQQPKREPMTRHETGVPELQRIEDECQATQPQTASRTVNEQNALVSDYGNNIILSESDQFIASPGSYNRRDNSLQFAKRPMDGLMQEGPMQMNYENSLGTRRTTQMPGVDTGRNTDVVQSPTKISKFQKAASRKMSPGQGDAEQSVHENSILDQPELLQMISDSDNPQLSASQIEKPTPSDIGHVMNIKRVSQITQSRKQNGDQSATFDSNHAIPTFNLGLDQGTTPNSRFANKEGANVTDGEQKSGQDQK